MNMHFRPKIQNGTVAKRPRAASSHQPAPRPTMTRPPLARPVTSRSIGVSAAATLAPLWAGISASEMAQTGLAALGLDERLQSTIVVAKEKTASHSRVLLGLIGCGVLLAGGFMLSLRDHFTAYAMGREEVKLKATIEQVETEQQQLGISLQRTSSPQTLERAARELAGLMPLEMERKKVVSATKKVAAAEKAKKSPSSKSAALKFPKAAEH